MFASYNAPHSLDKRCPRLPLLSKHASAFSRHLVEPAAPLVRLLDPRAPDPSALLEAIEQRIQGIDMERELTGGPRVDQLAQFVSVSWAWIEQREDEQFGRTPFQLTVKGLRVYT